MFIEEDIVLSQARRDGEGCKPFAFASLSKEFKSFHSWDSNEDSPFHVYKCIVPS